MDLIAAGFDHKGVSVQFLDAASFPPDALPAAYEQLLSIPVIRESVILSTCNRSEVYTVATDWHEGTRALRHFFETRIQKTGVPFPREAFRHFGNDRMVFHLFATISGLESLVVGETQIAGQIREAYRRASENGTTGPILNRLFHRAFETNKRIRAETRIGEGVVSVGHAAVQLAEKIFYPLKNCRVLLVGAGETARIVGKHFSEKGVATVWVANRTFSRAQTLAAEIGGQPLPLARLAGRLPEADVVVSATNSPDFLLTAKDLRSLSRKRDGRPLFLIDLAVPADFDPGIRHLENVVLYNMDDLGSIVEQNRKTREQEAELARTIIREEVQDFLKWLKGLEINPTIQELRRHFEAIRQEELRRFRGKFSDRDWLVVEELTRRMTNKMLHSPTVKLRELFDNPDGVHKISLFRQLFELDQS